MQLMRGKVVIREVGTIISVITKIRETGLTNKIVDSLIRITMISMTIQIHVEVTILILMAIIEVIIIETINLIITDIVTEAKILDKVIIEVHLILFAIRATKEAIMPQIVGLEEVRVMTLLSADAVEIIIIEIVLITIDEIIILAKIIIGNQNCTNYKMFQNKFAQMLQ
jgi:hypothetical protein